MKHWEKLRLTMSLAAFFCCAVLSFGGAAFSATTPPVVTVLPVIKEGSVTPTRVAQRASTGYFYVTDGHAEAVMVYNSVGQLVQKITTAKEPGGVGFAKNGDLLVTQGTYVAVLNPDTGVQKSTFGSFLHAFSIAVDNSATGTGNIFVSDIKNYVVQVFNDVYADVDVSAGTGHNPYRATDSVYRANFIGDSQIAYFSGPGFFNRPAGVAIEKNSGLLAVVDSLNGKVQFFDQAGNYINEIGQFGYDSAHQFVLLTYPQSIAFEYTAAGALDRAYLLDTYQSYVMVVDATAPILSNPTANPTQLIPWTWLADIGVYGHHNGDLIVPSDILIDKKDPANNRLLVTNGFGSTSVFGLSSLQPYDVFINGIGNNSMTVNWSSPGGSITGFRVFRSTVEGVTGSQVGADLPSTARSLTDSSLAQYTTYYYTVRALVSGVPTSNIDQVSAKTTGSFLLSVTINGTGSVNGTLSCAGGTCTTTLPSDSIASLTATDSAQSAFAVWAGDCFTTNHTCELLMDGPKSVTASFIKPLAFRVDGAYFDNLQDAYDAAAARTAPDTAVIKVLAGTWPSTLKATEYMTAWQGKTVIIEGGYDSTFTSNAGGSSTVTGRANLTAGKVIMKQFKVK